MKENLVLQSFHRRNGDSGPMGDKGPPGSKGAVGAKGMKGQEGTKGVKGNTGDQGKSYSKTIFFEGHSRIRKY